MLTVISDVKLVKWKTINTRLITLYRYQTFGLRCMDKSTMTEIRDFADFDMY